MSKYEETVYAATPSRLAHKKDEICKFISDKGYLPFHPFNAFPYELYEGHPKVGREKAMKVCQKAVKDNTHFWIFGISEGTLGELVYANEENKPIQRYYEQFDPDWKQFYEQLGKKYGDPLNLQKQIIAPRYLTPRELEDFQQTLIIQAYGERLKKNYYKIMGVDELAVSLANLMYWNGLTSDVNLEKSKEVMNAQSKPGSNSFGCYAYYFDEVTNPATGLKKFRLTRKR